MRRYIARAACAALSLLAMHCVSAETFTFGRGATCPYAKANDVPKIPALLKSINASDIAFSMYDFDIKDGSSTCTDDTFTDALTMFNSLKQPTVHVPGDNEWTDCQRLNNGSYDSLQRLTDLRRFMVPTLNSLGKKTMPLEHQGKLGEKFVENVRFAQKGIVFVGLNIPGSHNSRARRERLHQQECPHGRAMRSRSAR